jgi:hypothetical protein
MKNLITFLLMLIVSALQATTYQIGSDATYHQFSELPTLDPGDIVQFKKGEIFNPFIISQSGATGSPIVITSYGSGATPVISGFQTISGWTKEAPGIYSKIIRPQSAPNMLTIDGVQYVLGRYPNNTYLTYESCSTNVSITDNGLGTSTNWTGAELALVKNAYTLDRCTITNHVGDVLTYTSLGTTRNATAGKTYFIQNDLRTLDQYGEWYYAPGTGKLSVYFGAVNPATKITKVAVIDNLISNATGQDYITIDGLALEGSNSSAIKFTSGTDHCTFHNCSVSFSGFDGLTLSGTYATVNNVAITNCNAGGVVCNGANSIVENNTLTNIGAIAGQTNMIVSTIGITMNAASPVVQYNRITTTGYMGIYFTAGAVTGTIAHNFINYPCQVLFDSGGIYLGHDHPGTVIEYNIVLNSGGNAIYLDEYCTGVTVQNNTCAGCLNGCGIYVHKGSGNTIINNVSYNNKYAIRFSNGYISADDPAHGVVANNLNNNIVTNNLFVAKLTTQFVCAYLTRFSGYAASFATWTINNNVYARPVDDTNTIIADLPVTGSDSISFSAWQTLISQDANSMKSPKAISSVEDMYFVYNDANAARAVKMPGPGIGMNGIKRYASSFELQPGTSAVVIKEVLNPTGYRKPSVNKNGVPSFDKNGLPFVTK